MLENRYLSAGIAAMAGTSAGTANPGGHFAAAVIAAYFLAKEYHLDDQATAALRTALDQMMLAQPGHFPTSAHAPPAGDGEARIVSALAASIDRFVTIGHNVIFATLALKALRQRGTPITEHEAAGIARTVTAMGAGGPPTEIFGMPVPTEITADMQPYDGPGEIASACLTVASKFQHIYSGQFQGYACHLLTHGHALIELERLGYRELARRGHRPHRLQARQLSVLFNWSGTGQQPAEALTHTPHEAAFWRHPFPWTWWGGHVFKYAYHHTALLALVDPELRARAQPNIARMFG